MAKLTQALVVCSLASCTTVTNPPAPSAIACLDEAAFRMHLEPILIRDCSYMACHGQLLSPLRIYSIGKLRRGDSTTLEARTQPLTDEERHLNFLSAEAFTFDGVAPDDNLLVRKPLAAGLGGFEHGGGVIWDGLDDPRVVALRDWLSRSEGTCAP